jgi:hypothetical protein
VPGNPTLQGFLDTFQNEHGLEITMLSSGVSVRAGSTNLSADS